MKETERQLEIEKLLIEKEIDERGLENYLEDFKRDISKYKMMSGLNNKEIIEQFDENQNNELDF